MAYTLSFRCPMPLLPMENGTRFCDSCERTVTDLCGLPEMDARRWLEKNAGSACVRVRVDRGGQLWAGALLLGVMSGQALASRDEEIEGDMVESFDSGDTRLLSYETDQEMGFDEFQTLNHLFSKNPGPFRILLGNELEREVHIWINYHEEVTVSLVGADSPLTPREQAAIERIRALPWPHDSQRITVRLRH